MPHFKKCLRIQAKPSFFIKFVCHYLFFMILFYIIINRRLFFLRLGYNYHGNLTCNGPKWMARGFPNVPLIRRKFSISLVRRIQSQSLIWLTYFSSWYLSLAYVAHNTQAYSPNLMYSSSNECHQTRVSLEWRSKTLS